MKTLMKNKRDLVKTILIVVICFVALISLCYGIYRATNNEEIHAKEDLTSLVNNNSTVNKSTAELFEYTYTEEETRYLINDTSVDYIQTDINNTSNKLSIFISYDDDNHNLKGIVIKRIDIIYSNYHTRTNKYYSYFYEDYIYSGNDIEDLTEMLESIRSVDVIDIVN